MNKSAATKENLENFTINELTPAQNQQQVVVVNQDDKVLFSQCNSS